MHIFLNKTNDEQSWTLERLNLAILEAIKDDVILKALILEKFLSLQQSNFRAVATKFNFLIRISIL